MAEIGEYWMGVAGQEVGREGRDFLLGDFYDWSHQLSHTSITCNFSERERVTPPAKSTYQTERSHCTLPVLGRDVSNTHTVFLWSRNTEGSSPNQPTAMPTQQSCKINTIIHVSDLAGVKFF